MQTRAVPTLLTNEKHTVLKQRLQQYGTLIGTQWKAEVWLAFDEVWIVFPSVSHSVGSFERFEQLRKEKRLLNYKPLQS